MAGQNLTPLQAQEDRGEAGEPRPQVTWARLGPAAKVIRAELDSVVPPQPSVAAVAVGEQARPDLTRCRLPQAQAVQERHPPLLVQASPEQAVVAAAVKQLVALLDQAVAVLAEAAKVQQATVLQTRAAAAGAQRQA